MQRDGELMPLMFPFYKSCMKMNIIFTCFVCQVSLQNILPFPASSGTVTSQLPPLMQRFIPAHCTLLTEMLVRDATGSSHGRDTDEPGVLRGLPQFLRANFGVVPWDRWQLLTLPGSQTILLFDAMLLNIICWRHSRKQPLINIRHLYVFECIHHLDVKTLCWLV
jgi:hypothetical protein